MISSSTRDKMVESDGLRNTSKPERVPAKRHRYGKDEDDEGGRERHHNRQRTTGRLSHEDRRQGPERADEQEAGSETDGPKEKPSYEPSGRLAQDAAPTRNGVVLKYSEPDDTAPPPKRPLYRMYVFEGDDIVDTIRLSEKSWYLYGRDERVAHIVVADSSVSKQHAVIQYRRKVTVDKYGDKEEKIK